MEKQKTAIEILIEYNKKRRAVLVHQRERVKNLDWVYESFRIAGQIREVDFQIKKLQALKSTTERDQIEAYNKDLLDSLKNLVSESYKLKLQHNNPDFRKALESAEQFLINIRKR